MPAVLHGRVLRKLERKAITPEGTAGTDQPAPSKDVGFW
jgi:hypothetical protein